MNQNNFLKKSVEEICKCLQRKQVKLQDIVMHVKVQLSNKTYSEDLLNGKEDHILPILDIISESYEIKNHQMCCKAIDLIIHKGIKGEIYNVGTNNEFKNKEIIDKVLTELKIDKYKFTYINGRVYDDKRYSLNCDKIKNELDWQIESNFTSSFKETVYWFKTNINWIKMMLDKK